MGFSVCIHDERHDTNGAPIMKHWKMKRDKKYIKRVNKIHEPRAIRRVKCRATFKICKEDWFILLNNVTLLDIQVYTLTRHLQANKKWTVSEIKELSVSNERDRDRQFSVEKKARIVKNPLVVKTKGAPSTNVNKGVNTRKCGYCKQEEHTAQKC
ncbi:hypothetical protein CUMW_214630 [Citrus unshiu]|uniref:Uncharacterized protein n=1 Tax=Citrus unshiu TaxID=55188 RepID=A0A2H5QBL2_CITUN|nr:hypothetical protein CUMW_214630 [Citrus unshiu]